MKATLEFNLPEENEEFEMKINAGKYYCALEDLREFLRSKLKHGDLPPETEAVYEEVREKFYDVLKDNEVEL